MPTKSSIVACPSAAPIVCDQKLGRLDAHDKKNQTRKDNLGSTSLGL